MTINFTKKSHKSDRYFYADDKNLWENNCQEKNDI